MKVIDKQSGVQGPEIAPSNLAEQNLRLAYYVAGKFRDCGIDFEELVSICSFGLVKAANAFDPGKAKFATFAVTAMTNEVLMALKKTQREKGRSSVSLDETLEDGRLVSDIIPDEKDCFASIHMWGFYQSCIEELTDKEKEIVHLLIISGKTQNQVGRRLGFSQSYIGRLYRNAVRKMRAAAQE